jgi:hypothetical protein
MTPRRNTSAPAPKQAPLELHEFCLMIPEASEEDYRRLVEDIKANGQQEAISMFEGKILDGRYRYRACLELGISPIFTGVPFYGHKHARREAFAFVLSKNLARRHLTIEQRKALARQIFKEDPSISTRAAAGKVGLSPKTAEKERPTCGKSTRRDTKGRKVGVRPKKTTGHKTNGSKPPVREPTINDLAVSQPLDSSKSLVEPRQQRTPAEEAIAMLEKGMLHAHMVTEPEPANGSGGAGVAAVYRDALNTMRSIFSDQCKNLSADGRVAFRRDVLAMIDDVMPPARARKSEIAAAKRDLMQKLQPHFDELEQGVALLRGDAERRDAPPMADRPKP